MGPLTQKINNVSNFSKKEIIKIIKKICISRKVESVNLWSWPHLARLVSGLNKRLLTLKKICVKEKILITKTIEEFRRSKSLKIYLM